MPAQANTVANSNKLPSQALGNATSETQFLGSDGNILTVYLPTSNKFVRGKSAAFTVWVQGYVTTGTTSNWTPKLYYGNSTTIGSNTGIAAPSGVSLATLTRSWYIAATLNWDSGSKRLTGSFDSQIGDTYVAPASLSVVAVSLKKKAADITTVGFSVTGIFGSTNASNTAVVDFFEIQST